MNVVVIIGNLSREVNLHTEGKTPFCNLNVAVNDGWGDHEHTSFIPVKAFGKTAENCAKYLTKGRKVAVTGRIQTGSYEKDGQKIYTTEVIANNVEFLSKPTEVDEASEEEVVADELSDDDIPF